MTDQMSLGLDRPQDWTELSYGRGPCRNCGCIEGRHRPGKRRGECLYAAGHRDRPCTRYAA